MRRTLALLALTCLVAIPLVAADSPAPEADLPAPSVEQAPADQPAPDAEAPAMTPAEENIAPILDDGRVEMACTQYSCDRFCKTNYGDWSFGFCSGGVCYCAV